MIYISIGNIEGESGANVHLSISHNMPLVVLDDLLYNGQANARPFKLLVMQALEHFKDPVAKSGIKTDAVIRNRDLGIQAIGQNSLLLCNVCTFYNLVLDCDMDALLVRELDGV